MALHQAALMAQCAVAFALFVIGAAALLTAGSVGKRLIALAVVNLAALYALAALAAPESILVAAVFAGFAQICIGVSVMVRLKEDYGSVLTRHLDAADAESERTDPA